MTCDHHFHCPLCHMSGMYCKCEKPPEAVYCCGCGRVEEI